MTHPVTRARTTTDIDRDLDRYRWLRDQALDRLSPDGVELADIRIDQLLDERLALR